MKDEDVADEFAMMWQASPGLASFILSMYFAIPLSVAVAWVVTGSWWALFIALWLGHDAARGFGE